VSELTAIFMTPGAFDCTLSQIGILPNVCNEDKTIRKGAEFLVPKNAE
jgi:hypothetical protein